ncbi:MAG: hypothetical protein ACYTEU_11015 [Planctomycetota bacterium]
MPDGTGVDVTLAIPGVVDVAVVCHLSGACVVVTVEPGTGWECFVED